MPRPIIGITLDWQKEGSFSKHPHFALREHWFKAIYRAGGLPMAIPHVTEAIPEYLNIIKGLLVPGGEFAAPEEWYVPSAEPMPYQPSPRSSFDKAVVEEALARDLPLLGVCAGMQFMGCIKGCKMTRNVQSYFNTPHNHWDDKPVTQTAHPLNVMPGTLLASIVNVPSFAINSHHREGIATAPKEVKINAIAPDGVIEGIELPGYRFALGVQWHPEYEISAEDKAILQAFVAAAK